MTWKSYAAVSGAGLLATYLVSTPPTAPPDRTGASRAPAARPAPAAVDIAEEASRLRIRMPAAAQYDEPSRNPFRFGARDVARPPARAAVDLVPAPPVVSSEPVPAPPPIRLSGIATDTVAGTSQRTAILLTPAGVVTVREGDAVGSEYRVGRIEEHAVELVGNDGASRRLLLRP